MKTIKTTTGLDMPLAEIITGLVRHIYDDGDVNSAELNLLLTADDDSDNLHVTVTVSLVPKEVEEISSTIQ